MAYERPTRDRNQGDYYGRPNSQDYGRDFGSSGRSTYSSARDYAAAGESGDHDRGRYGDRDGYGQRGAGGRDYYGGQSYGRGRAGQGDRYGQDQGRSHDRETDYHGSYASDGRRFEDVGRARHADDDNYRSRGAGDGRQSQGYDSDDRGFFARAGDEVRSWFGDDEAERRREADARYDERSYGGRPSNDRDDHYHSWRSGQIAALDRDYDEYRKENRSKFETEFSTWRNERQGQRASLGSIQEHMEVLGSDGAHVGTVDKVRGDRVLLTKTDKDAGGVHHSIPSRWIKTVDTKVNLSKTADEAKAAWKEEERKSALVDYGDRTGREDSDVTKGRTLGRSFTGTY